MRSFIISIFIIFYTATLTIAQSNWEWQKPLPQGNTITYFRTFGGDSIFAYGWFDGLVMRSINGGQNWDLNYQVSGSRYVNQVCFTNINTGWAVGDSGRVHKTTDGGLSWTGYAVNDPTLYSRYSAVFFINDMLGWVAGNSENISRTIDGGETWTHYPYSPTATIYSIYFLNDTLGWAAGSAGRIYHTTDGGINWTYQPQGGFSTLNDIYFLNPDTGWAVGSVETILRTNNGGAVWNEVQSFVSFYNLNDVYFWDEHNGIAVGDVGLLLKSDDTGAAWSYIDAGTESDFKTLSFQSEQNIWIAGLGGIMMNSSDGGDNWNEISELTTPASLECIEFIDENNGWAAGGTIARTTDGGENWVDLMQTTGNIVDVELLGAENGYFLHSQTGNIFHTMDGGASWDTLNPGFGYPPYASLTFLDAQTGWLMDAQDSVLKTVNGGISWDRYAPDNIGSFFAQDMFFLDSNNGWIAGTNGIIQKSVDGGESWTPQNSGTTNVLYAVAFADANTGWAAGQNILLKTTNGGQDWNVLTDAYTINKFSILDSDNIWALGQAGGVHVALYSSDGGSTWQEEILPGKNMRGIHFLNNETGWICGLYGGVLKRNTVTSSFEPQSVESMRRDFILEQNYPNPFNPSTTISYTVGVHRDVPLQLSLIHI